MGVQAQHMAPSEGIPMGFTVQYGSCVGQNGGLSSLIKTMQLPKRRLLIPQDSLCFPWFKSPCGPQVWLLEPQWQLEPGYGPSFLKFYLATCFIINVITRSTGNTEIFAAIHNWGHMAAVTSALQIFQILDSFRGLFRGAGGEWMDRARTTF